MATSTKDFGGIIRQVYEPTTESLNVNIVGSGSPTLPNTVRLSDGTGYISSSVGVGYRALDVSIKNIPEILISHTDDSIRLGDGTNLSTITQNGIKYGLDVNMINSTLPLPTGAATEATLALIDSKLNTLGQKTSANSVPVVLASDQTLTVNADLEAFSATPDNVMTVGTIDGTKTGTKYGFVNNLVQQILAAHDRQEVYTYADFGTKNERITRIDYTSATFVGHTATRDFSYTLVGPNYRLDDISWSVT
jgi:hypothetical protein